MYRPDCGTWSRSSSSGSTGEQQKGAPNASGGNGMIFTKTGLNGNVRSDVPIPRSYRADYAINGEPLAGDREFESFSLQCRVHCEPASLAYAGMRRGDLPDGRGRGAAADVRRHPVADRSAAGTVRSAMSGPSLMIVILGRLER